MLNEIWENRGSGCSRRTIGLLVALLPCAVTLYFICAPYDDSTVKDEMPLPSFPEFSNDAQPALLLSRPLAASDGDQTAKPTVAADHGHRVVVVAQDVSRQSSRLVWWRSTDQGKSWDSPKGLENWPGDNNFMGDPWLQTDRRDRFQFVHLSVDLGSTRARTSSLVFRRSLDAAQTWWAPIEVAKDADRPVLGVSPNGKYLVIAAAMAERTADFPEKPLNANDPRFAEKAAAGIRLVSGIFCANNRGQNWKRLPGPAWKTHTIPFAVVTDDRGQIACSWVAQGHGLRSGVSSTTDRGQTWTETELVAALQPDRNHPFNGARFPVLALDGRGTIHVACVESGAKGLFVRRSTNWRKWEDPIKLSADPVEEVRMPAIAAFGPLVHVMWMERKNGRWKVYYRASKDHGLTWSEQLLLSAPHSGSTLIDDDGFTLISDDDQCSITDDGTGMAHAVWSVVGPPGKASGRVWHAAIRWQSIAIQKE
jgi:hypothetical protein